MKETTGKAKAVILAILVIQIIILFGNAVSYSPSNNLKKGSIRTPERGVITALAQSWTVTAVLSNESVSDAWMPKMVTDSMGNMHIVWYDSNPSEFAYRLWNTTLESWAPVEEVSFGYNGSSLAPTLVVDADGNVHVAWTDNTNYNGVGTDYDIFYSRWNATTGSWTPTVVVSNVSSGNSMSPALSIDTHGNVHVVWDDNWNYSGCGSDMDIFYRRWNATTNIWSATQVLSTNSTNFSDNPKIAVDSSGNAHVIWYEGDSPFFNVYYKCWNATISTWSSIQRLSTESQGHAHIPKIAADEASNLHVVWREQGAYGNSGTDDDIIYKRWNATMGNWTIAEVVSTESGWHSSYPDITTDAHGDIHVTWSEVLGIFYKYRNASTGTWSPVEEVSTESTDLSSKPTIAVDGMGCVHIAWEDTTNYLDAGTDYDIFYKKTVAIPEVPALASIVPNPDVDGIIELYWSEVDGATTYYVYRNTSLITSVDGMAPIGTSATANYTDAITSSGIYYYVVVAGNASGNGSLSNCESVQVIIFTIPGFELYLGFLGIMVLVLLTPHSTKRKPHN